MTKRSMTPEQREMEVYHAEMDCEYGGFFCDVADAQAWVDDLLRTRWWKKRCDVTEVYVTYGQRKTFPRGNNEASKRGSVGYLSICRGRLCEQISCMKWRIF